MKDMQLWKICYNYITLILDYLPNVSYFAIKLLVFTAQYLLPFCNLDNDRNDVSGYHVGTVYLNNLNISAAEMTQYLANIKLSNTNCLTKRYRVPFSEYVLKDQAVVKYTAHFYMAYYF